MAEISGQKVSEVFFSDYSRRKTGKLSLPQLAQAYLAVSDMEFLLPFFNLTVRDPFLPQRLISELVLLWGLLAETGGRC